MLTINEYVERYVRPANERLADQIVTDLLSRPIPRREPWFARLRVWMRRRFA